MSSSSNTNGSDDQDLNMPVFMIRSGWSLTEIDKLLSEHGSVGYLCIVYDRDGRATHRNIAMISDETFDSVRRSDENRNNRCDFSISRYRLRDHDFPRKGFSQSLYIPVPNEYKDQVVEVREHIQDGLHHFKEWDLLPEKSWSVRIPLENRETGAIKSGCFITFKRQVSLEMIAMVRTLMNDTYWPDEFNPDGERSALRCFWARDRKKSSPPKKKDLTPEERKKIRHEKKVAAFKHKVSQIQMKPQPEKPKVERPLDKEPEPQSFNMEQVQWPTLK